MSVNEGGVDVAGVVDGRFDGVFGDLVEHHALDGNFGLQHLKEVPCDGFSFAVLISCEVELVGPAECFLEFADRFLFGVGDDVVGLEAVFDVDGELAEGSPFEFGRQVARFDEVTDVADGGQHVVVVTEVL